MNANKKSNRKIIIINSANCNFFRHKLEKSFLTDSKNCLKDADLIGVIHDASNAWTRETLDIKVINLLEEYVNVPSILILNKVDLIKSKRKLLDVTRLLTENCLDGKIIPYSKPIKNRNMDRKGWKHFKEIFMVSSLTGNISIINLNS